MHMGASQLHAFSWDRALHGRNISSGKCTAGDLASRHMKRLVVHWPLSLVIVFLLAGVYLVLWVCSKVLAVFLYLEWAGTRSAAGLDTGVS